MAPSFMYRVGHPTAKMNTRGVGRQSPTKAPSWWGKDSPTPPGVGGYSVGLR
jgi:hypothetical protein